MKKSLLALAVISAATMASAEVKLSGQVGVQLTSVNGARATFETKSTRVQIDANEDIGGGNTAYARVRLNLDNKNGSISSNKGYVGIKGSFGDVRLGDSGTGCGYTEVGGMGVTEAQVLDGMADHAGCGPDGTVKKQGIRYTNDFGAFKVGASYRPGTVPGMDQFSIGLGGEFGPVEASLGYTDHSSNGAETFLVGLQGNFGDFKAGAQYQNTDQGGSDVDSWELGVNYSLASGDVYAGYGSTDYGSGSDVDGWMLGYKHNISDRTWTWIEIGDADGNSETSWSTGLVHKF